MAAAQTGPNNGTPAADVAPHPPGSRLMCSFYCTSDSYETDDSYHVGGSTTIAPQLYSTCSESGVEKNEFMIASYLRVLQDTFAQHQERETFFKTRIKFLTDKYERASRWPQEERRSPRSGLGETLKIFDEEKTKLKEDYRKELDQILNLYESEQKQSTLLLLSLKIYKEYLGVETVSLIEENKSLKEKQLGYTAIKKERDELRVKVNILSQRDAYWLSKSRSGRRWGRINITFGILATALFAFVLFRFQIAPLI
ncbi:hypothetical protein TWF192_005737 [Orbilia oligospora]|uniref:Uncharacterized protein n=1 Tax=Orbilia oligospora TaxID=2813651 RepID=A0A6G1MLK9_ORBOL|nr:hypothetical protein TWF191_003902 [Orbilia oligospora]KAF3263456.1 hypothetical protein TWF192_005737 [Orbilia oligospora]